MASQLLCTPLHNYATNSRWFQCGPHIHPEIAPCHGAFANPNYLPHPWTQPTHRPKLHPDPMSHFPQYTRQTDTHRPLTDGINDITCTNTHFCSVYVAMRLIVARSSADADGPCGAICHSKQQKWPSNSLKIVAIRAIRYTIHDFPLVFHYKYVFVLHHFEDNVTCFPKISSGHMTRPRLRGGRCSFQDYQLTTAYLCTKFDNCSISHSRVMTGAPKCEISHMTANMLHVFERRLVILRLKFHMGHLFTQPDADGPCEEPPIRNIALEKACNKGMTGKTFKDTLNRVIIIAAIDRPYTSITPVSGLFLQHLYLAPFPRYYYFSIDCLWPWQVLHL